MRVLPLGLEPRSVGKCQRQHGSFVHQVGSATAVLKETGVPRLSILCWNPGPKLVSPGAIENHIAGAWHIVASEEFLLHQDITRQFHVAHFRGCATRFNKHTFKPDLGIKPIYILADKAKCEGWAFEAVVTRARFGRIPRNGTSP